MHNVTQTVAPLYFKTSRCYRNFVISPKTAEFVRYTLCLFVCLLVSRSQKKLQADLAEIFREN